METPIRFIDVRETGVSRHQGGPIVMYGGLPVHHGTIILRELIMCPRWPGRFSISSPGAAENRVAILANKTLYADGAMSVVQD